MFDLSQKTTKINDFFFLRGAFVLDLDDNYATSSLWILEQIIGVSVAGQCGKIN